MNSTNLVTLINFSIILGNVYIADQANSRIRKVTVSTGIITTFVGTGTASYSGDGGAATSATIYNANGVAVDASGSQLYILCPFFLIINVALCYTR